jgi:hypothetical protein
MQPQINHFNRTGGARWSHCPNPASYCTIYKIGAILGSNIQDILTSFIKNAEDGARLALRKSRAGFTIQVVWPVRRAGGGKFWMARAARELPIVGPPDALA